MQQGTALLAGGGGTALPLPPPQAMDLGDPGGCTDAALTPTAQHHEEGELCPSQTQLEGTELGSDPTAQGDIPSHAASCSATKAGGRRGRKGMLGAVVFILPSQAR